MHLHLQPPSSAPQGHLVHHCTPEHVDSDAAELAQRKESVSIDVRPDVRLPLQTKTGASTLETTLSLPTVNSRYLYMRR